MRYTTLGSSDCRVSVVGLGCMNFAGHWSGVDKNAPDLRKRADEAMSAALECGITLYDHADIYCGGESERMFGEMIGADNSLRDRIVIQTKASIRWEGSPAKSDPTRVDFSYDHLMRAVEGSLKRLQCRYVDVLLLHQFDTLMDDDVGRALQRMKDDGMVRYFGVSNFTPAQIDLLKTFTDIPVITNQIRLNILEGEPFARYDQNTDILTGCQIRRITPQAWGAYCSGSLSGEKGEKDHPELVAAVVAASAELQCSFDAVQTAYLLRHPSAILPLVGSRTPGLIKDAVEGVDLSLSREQWYRLRNTALKSW